MTKLEQLIQEKCPNGVEYRKIKDIIQFCDKEAITKDELVNNGKYPVINSSRDILGHLDRYNNDGDTVILTSHGAYAGYCHYMNSKFFAGSLCYPMKTNDKNILNKYIYYYLQSKEQYIRDVCVNKSGVPYINFKSFSEHELPVPPLEVQREIVEILDKFTLLTAELTAELTARKEQFQSYLDKMFDGVSNTQKLGEFASIIRGGNFQKKDFVENGLPCIHYGQMYTHFGIVANNVLTYLPKIIFDKSKIANPNDIVMAVTSENVEDVCSCVAWVGNDDIAVSGHTAIIKHNQNAKYLSYYFHSSHFFKQKVLLAHGTKVIEVTPSKLAGINVPLPSLQEQQRIVGILDRFDTLCNDISSGLPAEIEARQKQYEYYRDKLLTFKRLEVC